MSKNIKEYNYVNDLGKNKTLTVELPAKPNGKYLCTIWSRDTGDFCGSGDMTKDELREFLQHYGLRLDF